MYIGPSLTRVNKGDTFTFKFTMTVADVPTTLTTPTVKAYEEGSNVEFTGGITLNVDYDGKTGLNELIIDTSDAAYSAGKNYDFFFSAGSIGAVTLVGTGFFHLALIPEPADLRAVNGGSTGATAGKLELAQLKVTATGSDDAFDLSAVDGIAIHAESSGFDAVRFKSEGGYGLNITSTALEAVQVGTDAEGYAAIHVHGGDAGTSYPGGPGVLIDAGRTSATHDGGPALVLIGGENVGDFSTRSGPAFIAVPGLINNNGAAAPFVAMISSAAYDDGDYITVTDQDAPALLLSTGVNANGLELIPSGTGKAINALGQIAITPPVDTNGVVVTATGASIGVQVTVEATGTAVDLSSGDTEVAIASSTGNAIGLFPAGTGKAVNALGQVLVAPTNTDDSALVLTPNGDGKSIDAVVEGSVGIVESLMLANAANAGKTNGMGTATAHLRDLEDTKNRVTASLDASGNRTSITLDVT